MAKTKRSRAILPVKSEAAVLAELIVSGMQEKKAKDIVSIDLRNLKNSFTDFFCSMPR
jgi:ribosomal silencing factor RsfS